MIKYLTYIHAAVPPANIRVNTWYPLEELRERFTIEQIKMYFTAMNFDINEIEEKTIKSKVKKSFKETI